MNYTSVKINREFPGSPMVSTPSFHFKGPGIQFLVEELRFHKVNGMANK